MPTWLTKTRACLVLAGLTLAVGAGDYQHTEGQLPALPPLCPSSPVSSPAIDACWESRNAEVDVYADRTRELRNDLEQRLKVYGGVIAVALLLALLFAVPEEPARRRRYFANVGTAGVVLLIGTAFLSSALSNGSLGAGGLGLWLPTLALLAAAAGGALIASADSGSAKPAAAAAVGVSPGDPAVPGWAEPADPRLRKLVQALPVLAIGFGILTVVFLFSWSGNQPACYSSDPEPQSAQIMEQLGKIAYFCTLGAGVGLLISRRWFIALAVIVPITVLAFLAALGVALRCG